MARKIKDKYIAPVAPIPEEEAPVEATPPKEETPAEPIPEEEIAEGGAPVEPSPEEEIAEGEAPVEPTGVATPDGKGVLPHSVLQAERGGRVEAEAKAAELEQQLQQVMQQANALQEQITELEAKKSATPEGYVDGGEVDAEEELPELGDLEDHPDEEHSMLAETFQMPSIAAAIRMIPAILKHVKFQSRLISQLVEIDNERFTAEQEAHTRQEKLAGDANKAEMEEALDNLPLARQYQAEDPKAEGPWGDFIKFHDDHINVHPEHSKLPHAERFRKALDMAKAIHGDKLGLEKGGKVPDAPQHEEGLKDEPKAPSEDMGEMPIEDRPLKTDTPEIIATADKPVSEWTEAELRNKAYETKPKVVAVKKTVTAIGALPGGEAINMTEKGPASKRLPPSEINKRLAEAAKKGDKELEKVQRELLAG